MRALAGLLLVLASASPAFGQHEVSASLIGNAWQVGTEHQVGSHEVEADAGREDDRRDLQASWELHRSWFVAGAHVQHQSDGDYRFEARYAHAGVSHSFSVVRFEAGVTTDASLRASVEAQGSIAALELSASVVTTQGRESVGAAAPQDTWHAAVRAKARWKVLLVEVWRHPLGHWTPQAGFRYGW